MNRKLLSILLLCLLMMCVTACGNEIPEMTEQENAMVSEYAANLLLKYSSSYNSRLVDTSQPPEGEVENAQTPDESSDNVAESLPQEVGDDVPGQDTEAQQEPAGQETELVQPEEAPAMTIAKVLGLDGVDVEYTGYRLCDSYPEEGASEEDLFFAMNAADGSKLLVLDLNVVNQTAENVECNTITIPAKYRVILNGEHTQNVLVTMLLDDFSAMDAQLVPQESIHAVLVAEISQERADSLQSVGLEIKLDDKKTVITQ